MKSRNLRQILEIILALGNFMNRGQRGNASGFRISSLANLIDTKSSTSKHVTLLHYLVDLIEKKVRALVHGWTIKINELKKGVKKSPNTELLPVYSFIIARKLIHSFTFLSYFLHVQFRSVQKVDGELSNVRVAAKVRWELTVGVEINYGKYKKHSYFECQIW